MWPTIASLGGGLLLGLGLAIWAAVERSKRAKAEVTIEQQKAALASLRRDIVAAAGSLESLREDKGRVDKQVQVLRLTVDELRAKLIECRDPSTVRDWLDEELKKQI